MRVRGYQLSGSLIPVLEGVSRPASTCRSNASITLHCVEVTRSDGTSLCWDFPSYGDALPRDLCHLIVEEGLRRSQAPARTDSTLNQ